MTAKIKIASGMILILFIPTIFGIAHAQYLGNLGEDGKTGVGTLEEAIFLAREKVIISQENPASGSGTPYLALDGVIGASIITAGVFGGIAAAFVIKSKSGRYVLPGAG